MVIDAASFVICILLTGDGVTAFTAGSTAKNIVLFVL
jgi:hypothetical protein